MSHMEIKSNTAYVGQMHRPETRPKSAATPISEFDYSFRPFTRKDLKLMAIWLAEPHVAQWWGDDPAQELADVEDHIDSISVEPFITELNGRPIAYVQSYDPHMEDNHPYRDQPFGTLGIDLCIGDAGLTGKGHGARLIDAFAAMLFEEGCPRVIIDPDPSNKAAVRASEKAGFTAFGTRTSEYGPALMMARDATEEEMNP
jgi:aminoglycoside 6'-N-acetyltransferase